MIIFNILDMMIVILKIIEIVKGLINAIEGISEAKEVEMTKIVGMRKTLKSCLSKTKKRNLKLYVRDIWEL